MNRLIVLTKLMPLQALTQFKSFKVLTSLCLFQMRRTDQMPTGGMRDNLGTTIKSGNLLELFFHPLTSFTLKSHFHQSAWLHQLQQLEVFNREALRPRQGM